MTLEITLIIIFSDGKANPDFLPPEKTGCYNLLPDHHPGRRLAYVTGALQHRKG